MTSIKIWLDVLVAFDLIRSYSVRLDLIRSDEFLLNLLDVVSSYEFLLVVRSYELRLHIILHSEHVGAAPNHLPATRIALRSHGCCTNWPSHYEYCILSTWMLHPLLETMAPCFKLKSVWRASAAPLPLKTMTHSDFPAAKFMARPLAANTSL